MIQKHKEKKDNYLTIKHFIEDMKKFDKKEIDWEEAEERLYEERCGRVCMRTCCCCKPLGMFIRSKLRKSRLDGMAKKPKKGPVDYFLYSLTQVKDAYDFYTDA